MNYQQTAKVYASARSCRYIFERWCNERRNWWRNCSCRYIFEEVASHDCLYDEILKGSAKNILHTMQIQRFNHRLDCVTQILFQYLNDFIVFIATQLKGITELKEILQIYENWSNKGRTKNVLFWGHLEALPINTTSIVYIYK